ncbi:hypothetical protein EGW08_000533 [Elysia chlorotica]|uniref:Uncharacterized protein n=1 Tax=Elysia chlorotica TaxID=188477 RepID=A0A433UCV8_ELYCH|nr:hypothetical protein EGW08_000533 [Elysia chlorotica]
MSSMISYALPVLVLAVLTYFQPAHAAPRQRLSLADLREAFAKPPLHKFYLPIEIAPAALVGAFKAHARNMDGDALEDPLDFIQQKRTTSSVEVAEPLSAAEIVQHPFVFNGMKRKMFWQPLGYMPASARAQNNAGKTANTGRSSNQDTGSNVFRYG